MVDGEQRGPEMPPGGFPRGRFDVERGQVVRGDEPPPVLEPSDGGDDAAAQAARDEAALALYAGMLSDALVVAVPVWIERIVVARATGAGLPDDDGLRAVAAQAGYLAVQDVGPRLGRLMATDIDRQESSPLQLLREAVVHATAALRRLGVAPLVRDPQASELHPDDDYDLVPGAFADVDEALTEVGVQWGAAKAHVHLQRRRRATGG